MTKPGSGFTAYGMPSHWRDNIKRILVNNAPPGREVTGSSRTPLQLLEGAITPAGLHYVRIHNGVPDIDPNQHTLVIYGMVKQPLTFTVDSLMRYPMQSEIRFMECAGNSGGMNAPAAPQQTAGDIHGLLSGSEWTGVKLSTLLDEAGLDSKASWILAEGADGAGMSRSVPVWKALDDAMIALYQNGEPIRPEQGFPMRLLLPGFEGNTNVKWLRRLKVMDTPMYTRDETSRYTELMPDGKAREFMLQMEPKSVILKPSFGVNMQGGRLLRDLRSRLVRFGPRAPRRHFRRWRQELDGSGPHRSGAAQSADALPPSLDVERGTGDADEPHHGRERRRSEDACRLGRAICAAAELPFQRHPKLGRRRRRQGEQCLCLAA